MADGRSSKRGGGQDQLSPVSVAEIRENVDADKARGLEAIKKAAHELRNFQQLVFTTDITGKPDLNIIYGRFKREQLRSLETVYRTPFYCRVDTTMTLDGEDEELQVLISKARETG